MALSTLPALSIGVRRNNDTGCRDAYLVAKEDRMTTQDSNTMDHMVILFADIAGSTRLYEMLGNDEAQRIVQQVMSLLTVATNAHNGTVIKTIGDEILCTFTTVDEAMLAAGEMHRALQLAGAAGVLRPPNISVRIGICCIKLSSI